MVQKNSVLRKAVIPAAFLVMGLAIGYIVRDVLPHRPATAGFSEKRESGFQFVNPLLECERGGELIGNEELRPFRNTIEQYVRERMRFAGVDGASVYFRELNDGLWFSIGETEQFTPASLRKVPLMIAVLKQEEREPGFLDRKVRFQLKTDHTMQQTIKPSVPMTPGREYTVAELVRRMIVYSDNNAFMVLSGTIDPQHLSTVYEDLNMPNPALTRPDDHLSVHTYASFFRILFNASYLSKQRSEEALDLLSRTEFTGGIVAGVPPQIAVAHKFGEKRDDDAGKFQLHDCGIVYYPRNPYLLCIMTRGKSFEYLDDAIAGISKAVYSEIDSQHRLHN